MRQSKWIAVIFVWVVSSVAYAENTQESDQNSSREPAVAENKSNQSDSSSVFDRLVDAISEAASSNRDYGKEISDR